MHPRDILPEIVRRRRTPCPKPMSAAGTARLEKPSFSLFPAPDVQSPAAGWAQYMHMASRRRRLFRRVSGNRAEDCRQVRRAPEPLRRVLQWLGGMRASSNGAFQGQTWLVGSHRPGAAELTL